MARVDFYILNDQNPAEKFTCSIASKIIRRGHNIHIHTESRETAGTLDDFLWTYRDISFVPHILADQINQQVAPITIGWNGSERGTDDVLLNLCTDVPDFAGSFARIIEIVSADGAQREQARKRYRRYRDMGFELHNHDI